jgi:hypothetical protein
VKDVRMKEMVCKRYAPIVLVKESRATEKQLHGHQDSDYSYFDVIAFHTYLLSVRF